MKAPMEVLQKLVKAEGGKIILLVMDGLGGLPVECRTALQHARTPNMDRLASLHSVGLMDPVFPGITPGSGPGHLSLFGYDPLEYDIGRGILEALGVDMEVLPGDVTARGNFCTLKGSMVVDRRAGRIPDEKNRELIGKLKENIKEIDGIQVILKSGKEHRFVVLFRGEGLTGSATDTDPHREGEPVLFSQPIDGGNRIADIVNKFSQIAMEVLKDEMPANGVILRGITGAPNIPPFPEIYKVSSLAIATYPMYRGIAKLLGMEIARIDGESIEDEIDVLKENFNHYDYFFLHIKKTDSHGEDGNFEGKVGVIEEVDRLIPEVLELKPDVFAITGDHSTPASYKAHSWHPVPFLLVSRWTRISGVKGFNELECARGDMGRIPGIYLTSLLLAHAGRLDKFGA